MKTKLANILLLFALMGGTVCQLSAQSYSDYVNKRVCWNDGKISWSNFEAKVPADAPDTIISFVSVSSDPYCKTLKNGNKTYEYYWTKSYLQPTESWYRPEKTSDNHLKMLQVKFDLWELFTRKGIIEYSSTPGYVDWDDMSDYYKGLYHRRVDELVHVTDDGKNSEAIDHYAAIVAEELAAATFDPIAIADTAKFSHGMSGSVGLITNIPRSDYVSPAIGVDFTASFYIKSMLYGMSLDFGGAKCTKYIETHTGEICKGDALLAGSMNLMVGKIAYQKEGYMLTPYLGLGVRFYNGGTNFEADDDNETLTEKAGFTMGMGALFEIPLSQKVRIKTESSHGITSNNRSLLIKPYLSCSKFHGDMGWMPSVNIAVSYCWSELYSFNHSL